MQDSPRYTEILKCLSLTESYGLMTMAYSFHNGAQRRVTSWSLNSYKAPDFKKVNPGLEMEDRHQ
jgi:hypothetical protein